jgi:5-methylcytosine-specific restriction endonuclease McrA
MSRPSIPCSVCGTMLWITRNGSLPPELITCQTCRRMRRLSLCRNCGRAFDSRHRGRFYCSTACFNSTRIAKPERRRSNAALRRARKRAVEYEKVDARVVFERDRWICHICKRPIDKRLSGISARGATLDHVIPLALGGPHTYANIKTAHRRCNERKGKKWEPPKASQ